MTTTKADLVDRVASHANLTHTQANECIRTILGEIVDTLHRDENIELRGFG